MYLRYLGQKRQEDLARAIASSPESSTVFEALKRGEYSLSYTFRAAEMVLIYEALGVDGVIGIAVTSDKKIADAYDELQPLEPKQCAFALYLSENEEAEDEERLRQRYGANYDILYSVASLSPEEARALAESKADLAELEKDLGDLDYGGFAVSNSPSLSFDIEGLNAFKGSIYPILLGTKAHTGRDIGSFLALVKRGGTISEGRGSYLNVGVDAFPPEDQRILFYLSRYSSEGPDLGYGSGRSVDASIIVDVLSMCRGKTITFDRRPCLVESEPTHITMSIDRDGRIGASLLPGPDERAFSGDSVVVLFSPSEGRMKILSFVSKKSKRLYEFLLEHPKFPYLALKEEIATAILPVMQKEVEADVSFVEESKKLKTQIAYYLTYEEELDVPQLHFETQFKSRGLPIEKEEYLRSFGDNYARFASLLSDFSLPENGVIKEDNRIGEILDLDLSPLTEVATLYLSDNILPSLVQGQPSLRLATSSGLDWFEIEVKSDTLSPKEINQILKAYRSKKKYVRIGKTYYRTDDPAMKEAVKELFLRPGSDLTSERLPLYQALKLKNTKGINVEIDEKLVNLFQSIAHYQNEEVTLSKAMEKHLRPYQKEGVRYLHALARFGLGGILADDMGLGKTLEMIAFLSSIDLKAPTLIVCPKSLTYNWKGEFAKWDDKREVFVIDGLKVMRESLYRGASKTPNAVYVVSYDSLRNDIEAAKLTEWGVVILDEAQYIANASAAKTKAVKELPTKLRFALTGTPIQNSYMDLWSIMDFLLPKYLEGFTEFRSLYASLAETKPAMVDKLEREVAPFILRRTKDEVLKDLPPKTEEVMTITMDEKGEKLYKAYFAETKKSLLEARNEHRADRIAILAELTRLRQICVDPTSFLDNYDDLSAKLERTISLCQEACGGGHKVLVFSSFVTVLKHLQAELKNVSIPAHLIYGAVSGEDRLAMAEDFNKKDKVKVMLVSLKAGGTGLNLVGADIVIHLDPWWNLAAENQASDRAHRIGQTRPVTVLKLVCKGTIEEKIIELQELKRSLTKIIRVADEDGSALTDEDIKFLLS